MTEEPASREARGWRIDLVIAVCALLMSTLATAASWWQSRVVATQLSSQVWPYVAVAETVSPAGLEVDVSNDGLGPAVIRSLLLTVDGKPRRSAVDATRALLGPSAPLPRGAFASVGVGSVIKIGGAVRLLRIENGDLIRRLVPQAGRVDLRICYCSILGDCWLRTMRGDTEPARTASCPVDGPDHYSGYGGPP